MFCPNCGTNLPENAAFCPGCGDKITVKAEQIYEQPQAGKSNSQFENNNRQYDPQNDAYSYQNEPYGYQEDCYVSPDAGKVDFKTAVKLYFKNYANFKGRSTRSEYWWSYLFELLVSFATGLIPFSTQINYLSGEITISYLSVIASLVLFIPGLAVSVRRLHDTGVSGVYMFINLIPFVGWIFYIIQLCKDSVGDNEWGPRAR